MRSYHIRLACAVALALACLAPPGAHHARQGASSPSFAFRAGQAVYIVAFTRTLEAVISDTEMALGARRYTNDYDLDTERKVRKGMEEWRYFRIVDKPSEADFVFLVYREDNSVEGLALPFEAYRQHFKEQFDLDALREGAHGRYVAGPLNFPTVSRLSDRLVKQFREKVAGGGRANR